MRTKKIASPFKVERKTDDGPPLRRKGVLLEMVEETGAIPWGKLRKGDSIRFTPRPGVVVNRLSSLLRTHAWVQGKKYYGVSMSCTKHVDSTGQIYFRIRRNK